MVTIQVKVTGQIQRLLQRQKKVKIKRQILGFWRSSRKMDRPWSEKVTFEVMVKGETKIISGHATED